MILKYVMAAYMFFFLLGCGANAKTHTKATLKYPEGRLKTTAYVIEGTIVGEPTADLEILLTNDQVVNEIFGVCHSTHYLCNKYLDDAPIMESKREEYEYIKIYLGEFEGTPIGEETVFDNHRDAKVGFFVSQPKDQGGVYIDSGKFHVNDYKIKMLYRSKPTRDLSEDALDLDLSFETPQETFNVTVQTQAKKSAITYEYVE